METTSLAKGTAAPVDFGRTPVDRTAVRVMVVDDSAVVRGLVSRWIDEEPGLHVVARHENGKRALADVAKSSPDVILLDIDMPVMDGLEALPLLLRARPGVRVLVVSTLTQRNAEMGLKALSLGALDYVPKPDTNREIVSAPDFQREVVRKVKALSLARQKRSQVAAPAADDATFSLRGFSLVPPRAIVFGSSTGGPEYLSAVLAALSPALDQTPVLISQHMPPLVTAAFAERLARVTGRPAAEAQDGEPVMPGRIYVAPGGRHMAVRSGRTPYISIENGPAIHHCIPSVDRLFMSAAAVYGPAALAVVLSGMGHDGTEGASAIAESGGSVIAQDMASSTIWGMPGSVVAAGLCAAVLPPDQIASVAAWLIGGERT